MANDIKIIGWTCRGFRSPDHEVELLNQKGEPYHVSLIQMPNGTGKTTTLELLRLALSGGATSCSTQYIKEFAKSQESAEPGVMEVRLLIDKKPITFIMSFDFLQGKAEYKTTYKSGQSSGFVPPQEIKKFLNPDFINYFILDGELAELLLKDDRAAAQDVIDALFQVDSLKKIGKRIEDYWTLKANTVTTRTEQGLTRQKNLVMEIKQRLAYLEKICKAIDEKIKQLNTQLINRKTDHQTAIENNRLKNEALLNAQSSFHIAEKEQINSTTKLLTACQSPQNLTVIFAKSIRSLKLGLDRVKLPEAAAREFFEELCSEPECICGRVIDAEIAKTIKIKSAQYLGSDDMSLLNSLKTAIEEAVDKEKPEKHRMQLLDDVKNLTDKVRAVNIAKTVLDELNRKASEIDPKVKEAQDEIERLTRELKESELIREQFDSEESSSQIANITGLNVLRNKLKENEVYLAEITGTLSIKNKTEKLNTILLASYERATKIISTELVEETNNNLKKWLPNNKLEVASIHGHLKLKGKKQGSVGENLSVAYGFLSTLFNRTNHSLPFIVDSPAGALDFDVRPSIGSTIPKLTSQFVTFTISSEREGFIAGGIDTATKDIQYITIFRRSIEKYKLAADKIKNKVITDDGIIVDDKDFYQKFQLNKE
jgi:DNA sulfur modification protein DndD